MTRRSFDPATDTEHREGVLSALVPARRRLVIAYFEDSRERTATRDGLAEYVTRHDEADVSTQERARVLLHHKDLPKLADAELIDYDTRSWTVRYWGAPTGVEAAEWTSFLTGEGMTEWNR